MSRPPELRLALDGLIVDCFAGGGGASTGIEMALGRSPDIAINHDPQAVAMHRINHPATEHYCENITELTPRKVTRGQHVALAWFSPDCTFHSKARGGKPFRDRNKARRLRGLAWVVVRWAKDVRPDVIMLENVEEFAKWGPLGTDGKPCPLRQGFTFRRWCSQLQNLGYELDMRELRACDYGAPTTRKRLFIIARCDGKPIMWPEASHAKGGAHGLLPYRTAAECIDFSLPCPSIFLTKEEGQKVGAKRPLAENTMKRIARGLKKFVLDNPRPFIVGLAHGEHARGAGSRSHDLEEPVRTIHSGGNNFALVAPAVAKFRGDSAGHAATEPLPTITAGPKENPAGAAHALGVVEASLAPFIAPLTHQGSDRVESIEEPTPTITGAHRGERALVVPYLTEHANASNPRSFPADDPLRTQCANVKGGHFALVQPFLAGVGGRKGQSAETSTEQPFHTITGKADTVLVAPIGVPRYGEREGQEPRAMSLKQPAATIVPSQNGTQLVSAFLAKHFGGHETPGSQMSLPMDTVTARDHHGLVASSLIKMKGTGGGADIEEPLHTVQAQGFHHAEVRAFLMKFYGTGGQHGSLDDPLATIPSVDRFGLVMVDGVPHAIVDIGMRMLKPRELYLCQGFPPGYAIEFTYNGKPLPADAQVRMVGNSVSPVIPAAMLRANFAIAEERAA
jgi:DNA (cytosine-5)-methyltransferase 1